MPGHRRSLSSSCTGPDRREGDRLPPREAGRGREAARRCRGPARGSEPSGRRADTLAFEHNYTSGVIAWMPGDEPTDAQIGAIRDAFEKTARARLEPDGYACAAVLYCEQDGGAHVHVLAARCNLETGRSLHIAPPGCEKTFGLLRDAFNAEHGWSRPDDPARAKV